MADPRTDEKLLAAVDGEPEAYARTSEAVVRKRVSRGLAGLRARMRENGA